MKVIYTEFNLGPQIEQLTLYVASDATDDQVAQVWCAREPLVDGEVPRLLERPEDAGSHSPGDFDYLGADRVTTAMSCLVPTTSTRGWAGAATMLSTTKLTMQTVQSTAPEVQPRYACPYTSPH